MRSRKNNPSIIPVDRVQQRIRIIRGQRVILSGDLATLYGVAVRTFNQAVSRHGERFPADFMFQLTRSEANLVSRSQFVILNNTESPKPRPVDSTRGANLKYRPYAFTEQGVAMLSAVLRSPTAVRVSIEVVRTFVRLRQLLASHEDLRQKLESLEQKLSEHDERFTLVFDAIRQLMDDDAEDDAPKSPIGLHTEIAHRPSTKARRH